MIGNKEVPTKLTTPEAHVINYLLSEMINEKCSDCVMEVSSHSLELSRVNALDFNVGVFTNITSDHLDFHENFENYLSAKKILFNNLKRSASILYNKDDKNAASILDGSVANKYSYSRNANSDFWIDNVNYGLDGTNFNLILEKKTYEVETNLIGLFNAYNATAAIGASILSGVSVEEAIYGIYSTPQVPGRFEVISSSQKKVIIDYSHTSDSLEQALKAVKHIVGNERKIYTVFGCGGDRDKTKRPIMGGIAEIYSDFVFVTSDNPRTEDPLEIINDIKNGLSKDNHKIIVEREEAIKSAIESSNENAVILIAGKGHETYQEINGVRNYFSDKEVAEKYL
jgi:UDP-N-acetylmuramoyl-L-alanyl-D-glutamate--2,6-diaminopimelate ligase